MNLTTQWTCSCGAINGLRNRNCCRCGNGIPDHICQKIYREELIVQRKFFQAVNLQNHKEFWAKHGKTIISASKVCKIVGIVFVLLSAVCLIAVREQIRVDDIVCRFSVVETVVANRADTTDIKLRDFEEDMFLFKRSLKSELENFEKEFMEFRVLLDQRIEQIKEKKEEISNYVN